MKKLGIDSLIYSLGILANSVLGLFFFVLVARALGPTQFGIVSVIMAISVVASDIFDFGLSTSMLKFLSAASDSIKLGMSRDFFSYKIISALLVVFLGLLVSPFVTTLLFKNQTTWPVTWIGFLAAASLIFYSYVNGNLQARKRFISSVFLNLGSNGLRLVFTGYFFLLGRLDNNVSLLSYLVPIFVAPFVWGLFDNHVTFRFRLTRDVFMPVFKYGRWVAGSTALASITSRLDNFLLVNLTSAFQTGIYTSVQRFFLAGNQIPAAVALVTTPDLSSKDPQKSQQALKFGILMAVLMVIGLVGFIFLAPWLVPLTLGSGFVLSIVPAQLLALGTIFFVLASPFNSFILYTKEKSQWLFWAGIVKFAATILFNWLLIPVLASSGAAAAFSVVSFLSLLLTLFFYTR